MHRSHPQLAVGTVSLRRVYELDTVTIESIQSSISAETVQKMIQWSHWNVFTFTIESQQRVSVEFLNNDAFDQCMDKCDLFEDKFEVNIKPHVKYVDEDTHVIIDPSPPPTTAQVTTTESTVSSSRVSMKNHRGWALILGHPVFFAEYAAHIRK